MTKQCGENVTVLNFNKGRRGRRRERCRVWKNYGFTLIDSFLNYGTQNV